MDVNYTTLFTPADQYNLKLKVESAGVTQQQVYPAQNGSGAVTFDLEAAFGEVKGKVQVTATLEPKSSTQENGSADDNGEVQEISIDTRTRKVIAAPEEVLPIAYSTNFWATTEDWKSCESVSVAVSNPQSARMQMVCNLKRNGYVAWGPVEGDYGKYHLEHSVSGMITHNSSADIYYSASYALTITPPAKGGTLAVTNAGAVVSSGDAVPGYSLLTVVATPDENWQLESLTTNGVAVASVGVGAVTTTLEMPYEEMSLAASFVVSDDYRNANKTALNDVTTNAIAQVAAMQLTEAEKTEKKTAIISIYMKQFGTIDSATKPDEVKAAVDQAKAEIARLLEPAVSPQARAEAFASATNAYNEVVTNITALSLSEAKKSAALAEAESLLTTATEAIAAATSPEALEDALAVQTAANTQLLANAGSEAEAEARAAARAVACASATNAYNEVVTNITALTLSEAKKSAALAEAAALLETATEAIAAATSAEALEDALAAQTAANAQLLDEASTTAEEEALAEALAKARAEAFVSATNAYNEVVTNITALSLSETKKSAALAEAESLLTTATEAIAAATSSEAFEDALAAQTAANAQLLDEASKTAEEEARAEALAKARAEAFASATNAYNEVVTNITALSLSETKKSAALAEAESLLETATEAIATGTSSEAFEDALATQTAANTQLLANADSEAEAEARAAALAKARAEAFVSATNAYNEVVTNITALTLSEAKKSAALAEAEALLTTATEAIATGTSSEAFEDALAAQTAANTQLLDEAGKAAEEEARAEALAKARAEAFASATNAYNEVVTNITALTLSEAKKSAALAEAESLLETATEAIAAATSSEAFEDALAAQTAANTQLLADAGSAAEAEACFEVAELTVTEGDTFTVPIYGGSTNANTAITVRLIKNTYKRMVWASLDGKRVRFPLQLTWKKGDLAPKKLVLTTVKATKKVEADRFLTLQLGSPVANAEGTPSVCTVTVRDQLEPSENVPYVRALAWPMNGGKVYGSGQLKKTSSTRTLRARANKWATFTGWYAAKADNAEEPDLENGFVTAAKNLKVSQADAGTYFAVFTEVMSVIAVTDPGDLTLAKGQYVEIPVRFSADPADPKAKVAVSGLPLGLKFDRKRNLIYGTPKRVQSRKVTVKGIGTAGRHTISFWISVLN